MKIALASDHAGFKLKKGIIEHLKSKGIELKDFGCDTEESVDYVDYAIKAIKNVVGGEFDRAILVCGTGLGMGIIANKFRGIRGTPCFDDFTARMSRLHNDSNCLTLGGRITPLDEAEEIVDIWLDTVFEDGRHQKRIEKISRLEDENFKLL